jgi:chaperone required for assembly of F1-ATPase
MSETPHDPMRAAQAAMRPAPLRRFYREASVGEAKGGFALLLDGRAALTLGKRRLVAPTRAAAELIAAEWAAQQETIDPASMPATRLANAAIDAVASALVETEAEIAGYAASDLLCYRAESPATLVAKEAAAFDPLLDWAAEAFGARLVVATGVVHVAQPEAALKAIAAALTRYRSPFALAALSVMTSLTGSALLALAVARGRLAAREAWRVAHVGEDFEIAQWGEDEEATRRREARWRDFVAAAKTIEAL